MAWNCSNKTNQAIWRLGIRDAINQAGSRRHVGAGSSHLRNALVIAQIALSFMLAINAGLLLRSFLALTEVPLGFRADHILVTYVHAPARGSIFNQSGLENYLRAGQSLDEIIDRLKRVPNVVSVGAVMGLPTGQYNSDGSYAVEGKQTFSAMLSNAEWRSSEYAWALNLSPVRSDLACIAILRKK